MAVKTEASEKAHVDEGNGSISTLLPIFHYFQNFRPLKSDQRVWFQSCQLGQNFNGSSAKGPTRRDLQAH